MSQQHVLFSAAGEDNEGGGEESRRIQHRIVYRILSDAAMTHPTTPHHTRHDITSRQMHTFHRYPGGVNIQQIQYILHTQHIQHIQSIPLGDTGIDTHVTKNIGHFR